MPQSRGFPFRRVVVEHTLTGGARIWWEYEVDFRDPGSYSAQLQTSVSGLPTGGDWVNVGAPIVDDTFAVDDVRRLYGVRLDTWYRIVLTTDSSEYVSPPASTYGLLPERDWVLAREIIRLENLRFKLSGSCGYLLRRKRAGAACPRCLDVLTGQSGDSSCPQCFGTKFLGGYYPPLEGVWLDIGPDTLQEKKNPATPPGPAFSAGTPARLLAFPPVAHEDVWVDGTSGQRYLLTDAQQAAKVRNVPIVLLVSVRLLPYGDSAYLVPVFPGDAVDADRLPAVGDGSIRVTHDYGGEDALTYVDPDGCPIIGASVGAIPAEAYEAGCVDISCACVQTVTTANGRWQAAMNLFPARYFLIYHKPGEAGPDFVELDLRGVASNISSSSISGSSDGGSFSGL